MRQTAGQTLPGGLVIPSTGILAGADIPPTATFPQQESLVGVTHFAIHRRHYGQGWDTTTGAWPWPGKGSGDVAVRFDGTQKDRIEVPNHSGGLDVNNFTIVSGIAYDFSVDTDPVHQRFEIMEKAGSFWFNVREDTTPKYLLRVGGYFGGGAVDTFVGNTPIVSNVLTHVAATYDGAHMRTYINGTLDQTMAQTGTTATGATVTGIDENLVVGAKHRKGGAGDLAEAFANGLMYYFRVYNRALSAAELTQVMQGNPPSSGTLVAFDFKGVSGSTVPDISGNGENGAGKKGASGSETSWTVTTASAGSESGDSALTSPHVVPMIVQAATMTGTNGFPVCTAGGSNGTFANTRIVGGAQGLDRVTAGEWDAKYTASFNLIKAIPGPVIFIPWQEQNIPAMGAYWQWQKKTGETKAQAIARVTAARHHIKALADSLGASNIIWGHCPTLYVPSGDTQADVLATFPADADYHVGWFDAYRGNSPVKGTCDYVYNYLKAHGKPVGVAEWGDYPASQPTNLATALGAMKTATYEEILFFVPWAISGVSDNRFDAAAATLTAWKSFFADSLTQHYYVPGGVGLDTPPAFSGVPTVSDSTPVVGQTLTADPGVVTGSPAPVASYQWQSQ